jgi:transposase
VDEARFGQQGTLTRVWARKGSRPRAVRQAQYEWCYVFTAVCPETGEAVGLVLPYADTEAARALLEELSRRLAPDVHAVLIWDGAGYHTSGALRVPANITLLPLPPYAPELNPVENLWHYLRSHHWANRVYRDYDALVWAAVDSWRAVCLRPELVRTVCAAPYLEKRRN